MRSQAWQNGTFLCEIEKHTYICTADRSQRWHIRRRAALLGETMWQVFGLQASCGMQHSVVINMLHVSGEHNVRSQNPFPSQKIALFRDKVGCMELRELVAEKKFKQFAPLLVYLPLFCRSSCYKRPTNHNLLTRYSFLMWRERLVGMIDKYGDGCNTCPSSLPDLQKKLSQSSININHTDTNTHHNTAAEYFYLMLTGVTLATALIWLWWHVVTCKKFL